MEQVEGAGSRGGTGPAVGTSNGSGPARLVLMAAVARRHYLEERSKVEIAEELGISRFKVARLLDAARDEGIVRIEIVRQGRVDLDRSARLQERFGLRHAVVVDAGGGAVAERRGELGAAAARLLPEVLEDGDVLGVPWSRSVHAMTQRLDALPPARVVQLTGSLEVPEVDSSTVDIVRGLARLAGGDSSIFHAPFVLDDAETAEALRRQPGVARGLEAARTTTVAVVGVGAWTDGGSTIHDTLDPESRRRAAADGVVGELAGICFGAGGEPVCPDLAKRLVTVGHEVLVQARDVIAIVSGADRAEVVRAAVAGGLVRSLVVDAELATGLLGD